MTLGLVFLAGDEGRRLELALRRIAPAVAQGFRLVIVDRGAQDGTSERLEAFVQGAGQGARLLRLDAPAMDLPGALELARGEAGCSYLLGLTGEDLLCPQALGPLRHRLEQAAPDLAICAQGWWQTSAGVPLAPADAARLTAMAADPQPAAIDLRPDLRRLLPSAALTARRGAVRPVSGPLGDWAAYDAWVAAAGQVLVYPEPVLLRPLPKPSLQSLFSELTQSLGEGGSALEPTLLRIGGEMRFCDPAEAEAAITAASALLRGLSRALRGRAVAVPGPAGDLLAGLQAGGRRYGRLAARSVLAQQAAAEDRRRLAALADEILDLRRDLDLALPGPEYLRELYERLRSV